MMPLFGCCERGCGRALPGSYPTTTALLTKATELGWTVNDQELAIVCPACEAIEWLLWQIMAALGLKSRDVPVLVKITPDLLDLLARRMFEVTGTADFAEISRDSEPR